MQETRVPFLGKEDLLEKGSAVPWRRPQFSCAAPTLSSCPEPTPEVWVCNSDGYVDRPQRPAGSTHSSTRGLRPPDPPSCLQVPGLAHLLPEALSDFPLLEGAAFTLVPGPC